MAGLDNVLEQVKSPSISYNGILTKARHGYLSKRFNPGGFHILDEDWDTLVILDCCRFDVFKEVNFYRGLLSKKQSLASITHNFLKRNFEDRKAHDIVYLSANPKVGELSDLIDVFKIVGMWGDNKREKSGQENPIAITNPGPVVDKALDLHDRYPNKRHIVHLLPPHVPHSVKDGEPLGEDSPFRNYEAARNNEVDTGTMRSVYCENVQHVLDAIRPVVEYIDNKVVVTADHGELLGEGMPVFTKILHTRWGNKLHKYDYGHYDNVDVPELINVPWLELPFETRRQINEEPPAVDEFSAEIENHLKALGYQ